MTLLDWRHPRHYEPSGRLRPCRHCAGPTPLRDERAQPSHKTCAEAAATAAAAAAAATYRRTR